MNEMKTGLAIALGAAIAFPATTSAAQKPSPETTRPASGTRFHSVEAEVVSANLEKMTITVKVDGAEKTMPVSVLAEHRLREVKPGDRVEVGCKDTGGSHTQIVSIRPATKKKSK